MLRIRRGQCGALSLPQIGLAELAVGGSFLAKISHMKIHCRSEAGGKNESEDFVFTRRHPGAVDTYICVLADGQGGRANGAAAAKTACESVWQIASQHPQNTLFSGDAWLEILRKVDQQVVETGGYTTVVAVAISRHGAAGASSGDSKAYFKMPLQKEATEWTARQRKNPPVGSGSADFVPFAHQGIGGGRLLIVSDGAWKYCSYESLVESFDLSSDASIERIRQSVIQRNGSTLPDDFSAVVINVE
jgi:serine/threonine protein phosphatase PrpC